MYKEKETALGLTNNNFKQEVLESQIPVLVDFWASWCPPCKMIDPVIDELSKKLKGVIKVTKINVDQNPGPASDYNIVGVPTFIVFKNEKELIRRVGAQSKQQLFSMIKEAGIKFEE